MHIDDLRTNDDVPRITDMVGKSIQTLLEDAVETMSGNIIQSKKGATQKDVLDLPNHDNAESFIPNPEPILCNPSEKATQYQEVHHIINKSFDFLSLVKKCVQSSLSMVKYPDNPQRSTQCVNTWIRLLHETEKPGNIFRYYFEKKNVIPFPFASEKSKMSKIYFFMFSKTVDKNLMVYDIYHLCLMKYCN